MTFPRRGTRRLTVANREFVSHMSPNRVDYGAAQCTIQAATTSGRLLCFWPTINHGLPSPREASEVITFALENGWDPDSRGAPLWVTRDGTRLAITEVPPPHPYTMPPHNPLPRLDLGAQAPTVQFDHGTLEITLRGSTVTIRCIPPSPGPPRWTAELSIEGTGGYFTPRDVYPIVLADRLFVVTVCEHGNAGGYGWANLHCVLPGGIVAWQRMIDLYGQTGALRIVDGALGVTAGWRSKDYVALTTLPERFLDLDTGATRA